MKITRISATVTLTAIISSSVALARQEATKPAAPPRQAEPTKKSAASTVAPTGPFLVKPYLQLGHNPAPGTLALTWHTIDQDAAWTAEVRAAADQTWHTLTPAPTARRIAVPTIEPHRVYLATFTGLEPGKTFDYRIIKDQRVVFEASALAPRPADQTQKFVVFGDCGANTPEQRVIAYRAYLAKPDYVAITGDIVYGRGLISEYRTNFFPCYNAETASPSEGAPLLRSTLFIAAPGNHDIATRDLGKFPDAMAYFYYWFQPLNGLSGPEGGPLVAPVVGPPANKSAFLEAAGPAFPAMANFSFDYGNVHWTFLDANPTVDWTDSHLQEWVANDLKAAANARWRFVNFHQPGFNSSHHHFDEQYMRILAPVFEAGKVDVVFTGHVHNYQRSYPLTFVPADKNNAKPTVGPDGKRPTNRLVGGKWTLDKTFDGKSDTTPEGVIYIVTGAGGQHLYNPEQQDNPASWQEFTYNHISKIHSFTIVEVDGSTFTLSQVGVTGNEVDHIVITK